MKRYNRISLCLSAFFILLCLGTMDWAQRHGAAASDGNGPDPLFILVLILMWSAGIALVHSTGIGVALLARGKHRSREAKESMWGNGVLWLLIIAVWVWPKLTKTYDALPYDRLPTSKAFADIRNGSSLADFEKHYAQAQAGHSYDGFIDSVKSEAEMASRLDIMKSLKDKGSAFAVPGDEDGWIKNIDLVVTSNRDVDSRARLAAVQWLLGEGAPFGYSLGRKSAAFSNPELYQAWGAYKDLSDPATQQLLDLLIAHGVDITACDGGRSCPLWVMARFSKVDVVRYLIAHGAPVNRIDAQENDTALTQAIGGTGSDTKVETVKVLLDAGATVNLEDGGDVIAACDMASRAQDNSSRQVLQLLRDAHARIPPGVLKKFTDGAYNTEGEEITCLKSFL
jgi:hypothetical protein